MYVIEAVLPIVLILITGKYCAHKGIIKPEFSAYLLDFIFKIALPAFILIVVAKADPTQLTQPLWILSYALALSLSFGISMLISKFQKKTLKDATLLGITASFPNNGIIGAPLMLGLLGEKALIPIAMAAIVLGFAFIFTTMLLEISKKEHRDSFVTIVIETFKVPMTAATFAGLLFSFSPLQMPTLVSNYLTPLGNILIGGALFAIGMDLKLEGFMKSLKTSFGYVLVKLLLMPTLGLLFALYFELSPFLSVTLVLSCAISSLKVVYAFAQSYKGDVHAVGNSIASGATLSMVTLSFWVFLLTQTWPGVFN